MNQFEYFTYEEFGHYLDCTEQYLGNNNFYPDVIVTFPRGGLVPSTYLSHRLNIPIEIINSSKYDFKSKLSVTTKQMQRLVGKKVLIVDDIIDTGETMNEFLKLIGSLFTYHISTLAANPEYFNNDIHDIWYFHKFKDPEAFLVFPWEKV